MESLNSLTKGSSKENGNLTHNFDTSALNHSSKGPFLNMNTANSTSQFIPMHSTKKYAPGGKKTGLAQACGIKYLHGSFLQFDTGSQ